jgi:DNA polymerase-1
MFRPHNPEALELMTRGAIALARVEHNGIRVDRAYLLKAITKVGDRIGQLEDQLRSTDVWSTWRKRFGAGANLSSRPQLATVLFDEMGYPSPGVSASGRHKADGEALELVDLPFISDFIQVEKLKKLRGTYLEGTLHELSADDRLRCFYNLHLVMTYRSSADSTNIQNQPVRDPLSAKIIRRMYIPSEGCRIVESDFSAIEVRVGVGYHKDPTMKTYIEEDYDMHRDMACECFMATPEQMTKQIRHAGKNSFVFPEFYGDVYFSVCQGLWAAAVRNKLTTADGVSVIEHLKSKGIHSVGLCDPDVSPVPGTFEHHIQRVEKGFWKRRFRVYDQWKRDWFNEYQSRGWFSMLTGFTCGGAMRRNVVVNAPVQGAAFHCLLWCLIEIQSILLKRKMRTKIVGEIHDSLIADVPDEEFDEYCAIVKSVMTRKLVEHYRWINVPIQIEVEACGLGETWYDKKVVDV